MNKNWAQNYDLLSTNASFFLNITLQIFYTTTIEIVVYITYISAFKGRFLVENGQKTLFAFFVFYYSLYFSV